MEGIRIHKTQRNQGISGTLVLTGALWILSDHSITIAKYCTGCCMKRLSRNQSCHDRMEPTRWFKRHISGLNNWFLYEGGIPLHFDVWIQNWFLFNRLVLFLTPSGFMLGKSQGKSPANPNQRWGSLTLRSASFSFQSWDNCTRQSQVTLSNRLVAPNKLSVSFTLEQWLQWGEGDTRYHPLVVIGVRLTRASKHQLIWEI